MHNFEESEGMLKQINPLFKENDQRFFLQRFGPHFRISISCIWMQSLRFLLFKS